MKGGSATATVKFKITYAFQDEDLQGLEIVIRGTKFCNCSSCPTNNPTGSRSDEGLNNDVFYVVIACVGGLIVLVVVITVLYHCIMFGTLVYRRRKEQIE